MSDKPNVQYSLAKLRSETEEVEPFSVALSNSKVITFPDLNALESEEADDLLERIQQPDKNTWAVLKEWLSEKDAEALKAEKLTRAQILRLMRAASNYYEGFYGDLGEGAASKA